MNYKELASEYVKQKQASVENDAVFVGKEDHNVYFEDFLAQYAEYLFLTNEFWNSNLNELPDDENILFLAINNFGQKTIFVADVIMPDKGGHMIVRHDESTISYEIIAWHKFDL